LSDILILTHSLIALSVPPTWRSGYKWRHCTACIPVEIYLCNWEGNRRSGVALAIIEFVAYPLMSSKAYK